MGGLIIFILCSLHLVESVRTHREHKIHNIVLYPDKHSWCKTTPIKQVVTWPGCIAKEIDNNVCVGACFSYTIPQTEPSSPGDLISPYCDSCQPSQVEWLNLTLECTPQEEEIIETLGFEHSTPASINNASTTPILMHKSIQVITNCSCAACHGHAAHHDLFTKQDDDKPQASLLDVPELMGLMREIHTRKLANLTINRLDLSANEVLLPEMTLPPDEQEEQNEATDNKKEEQEKENEATGNKKEENTEIPPDIQVIIESSSEVTQLSTSSEASSTPDTSVHHPHSHQHHHNHHPHSSTSEHSISTSTEQINAPHEEAGVVEEPLPPQHGHKHHSHSHHHPHPHHHNNPTHIEVPQEIVQPAQEGAEMSYHDNLVPTDRSPDKEEEF